MTRRQAREELFNLLFESEFRADESEKEIYATSKENREFADDDFVYRAYFKIIENKEEIDNTIGAHAHGWKTQRLGRVSRAILRLAVYELLYEKDIPSSVTINEAVELSKKFDDEKARPFINGVLNSVKNSLAESK
jgi:N utilization substance protein B